MSSCIGFHLHQCHCLLTALNLLSMISFIAPALCNVRTLQVALLISLILFHCLGRFHSFGVFRGHRLGFLTVRFLSVTGCRPFDQPSTWRASPPYLQPPRQGDPSIPLGTGTHFGRLLRSAWAAVGLFFSPVTALG